MRHINFENSEWPFCAFPGVSANYVESEKNFPFPIRISVAAALFFFVIPKLYIQEDGNFTSMTYRAEHFFGAETSFSHPANLVFLPLSLPFTKENLNFSDTCLQYKRLENFTKHLLPNTHLFRKQWRFFHFPWYSIQKGKHMEGISAVHACEAHPAHGRIFLFHSSMPAEQILKAGGVLWAGMAGAGLQVIFLCWRPVFLLYKQGHASSSPVAAPIISGCPAPCQQRDMVPITRRGGGCQCGATIWPSRVPSETWCICLCPYFLVTIFTSSFTAFSEKEAEKASACPCSMLWACPAVHGGFTTLLHSVPCCP